VIACWDTAARRRCGAHRPWPPMKHERAAHVPGQRGSEGAQAGGLGDGVNWEALVSTPLVQAGVCHAIVAANRGHDSAAGGRKPTGEEQSEAASTGTRAGQSDENRKALP
jgi:hypothetical protein